MRPLRRGVEIDFPVPRLSLPFALVLVVRFTGKPAGILNQAKGKIGRDGFCVGLDGLSGGRKKCDFFVKI